MCMVTGMSDSERHRGYRSRKPPDSATFRSRMIAARESGDATALAALTAERNAEVVKWQYVPQFVVERLRHLPDVRAFGIDQAVSEGYIGLIFAVELFDHGRGVKPVTYYVQSVRRWILDHCVGIVRVPKWVHGSSSKARISSRSRDRAMTLSAKAKSVKLFVDVNDLSSPYAVSGEMTGKVVSSLAKYWPETPGEENDESRWFAEKLRIAMASLTERESAVIRAVFFDQKTLDEAGAPFGITGERTRQVKLIALKKLRIILSNLGVDRMIAAARGPDEPERN